MKVTVQTMKNVKYPVDITDEQTVLSIKQAINSAHQLGEPDEQKLIHKGKILKDDQTASGAGIKDNDVIVIMVSKKKPTAAQPTVQPTTQPATQAQPTAATQPAVSPSTPATTQSAATPSTQPSTTAPANVSSAASSNLVIGAAQEAVVTDLMSMGFERDLVVRALRAAFGNPDRAAEYLFSGNIPADAPAAAQPAATPAAGAAVSPSSAQAAQQPAMDPAMQANLANLFNSDQVGQLREMIQQNPELLPALLQRMSQSDPQLFQTLAANPQFLQQFLGGHSADPAALLTTLGAMSRGAGGAAGGAGAAGGPTRIQITQEEKAQLDQLEALGFSRQRALEAWLVCDRNVEMASSYLFSSADDEDFGGAGQGQDQGGAGSS